MKIIFANRRETGHLPGRKLRSLWRPPEPLVLALPRGWVPGHEELAMGAIATGGIRVLNDEVVKGSRIPTDVIDAVGDREEAELYRREQTYRHRSKPPEVKGRSVILVDDGVATGSTMLVAVKAVKNAGASYVSVATPVAPPSTVAKLRKVAVLSAPEPFHGVSQWYRDFAQTTDDEAREFLRMAQERELEHA